MRRLPDTISDAQRMGVDLDRGLSKAEVDRRRAEFGANQVPTVEGKSLWAMFVASLNDKTLMILIGAALIAIGVEVLQAVLIEGYAPHYLDGIAILCAVVIASVVTTLNEANAQKEFDALDAERADVPVTVQRDGHVTKVSIFDLVVGDVVLVGSGDRIPADGWLVSGVDLHIDQSSITGESIAVAKGPADRRLIGGAVVTEGNGVMLVTEVGVNSEMGKIHVELTRPESEQTPLQERLSKLADQIGYFGLGAAILTFAALAISGFARGTIEMEFSLTTGAALLQFLIVAVTIIVVAVPEGLPVAVTISLAYSVRKMARDKNLVRHLASCETMGAATVVCTDKTGTLTENRMSVEDVWLDGSDSFGEAQRALFAEIASVDSTAFLDDDEGRIRYVGNPTECALLAYTNANGGDYKAVRDGADIVHQVGFTSDRKRMSTLVDGGSQSRLLVKGAPEVVLALCDRIHGADDTVRPLGEDDRAAVVAEIARLSSQGRRTLALAYRALPDLVDPASTQIADLEVDLVLFAVVGIADPIRAEVRDAVGRAQRAGVEVKMVTGDNRVIAETIARDVGMLQDGDVVMDGDVFRALDDAAAEDAAVELRVLARSIPSDKHRLVQALQRRGHVVAVTGDGTNDATALRAADVGFSMGITGTEIAKEASDIVMVDDNFASIVSAIRWGRSIFSNIRKFLQFQLTVNVAALLTAFVAAVLGFGIPLNTVQLLWVNLIMDTLAALALAVEPPTDRLLEQAPHGRHAPLITRSMWISISVTGAGMVAVLFAIMQGDLLVPEGTSHAVKLTFVFNTFVWMQLFNEINARSTRFDRSAYAGLADSHFFIAVLIVTGLLQVGIVQYGGSFFKTVPLDGRLWLTSIGIGALVLVAGVLLRGAGRVFGLVEVQA